MTSIGATERATQRRVVLLFQELGYDYLGNKSEGDNPNVLEAELEQFLWAYQGYAEREDGELLTFEAPAGAWEGLRGYSRTILLSFLAESGKVPRA